MLQAVVAHGHYLYCWPWSGRVPQVKFELQRRVLVQRFSRASCYVHHSD